MDSLPSYGDKELFLKIADGDTAAFKILFDRHYASLCFYLRAMAENMPQAEDIVQEVFFRIWTRKQHLASVEYPKTYLYTAVKNAWLDHNKHNLSVKNTEEEIRKRWEEIEVPDDPSVVKEEVLKLIIEELDLLPDKYRTVLQLLYFEGLSYTQVSERLQVSESALRKQKERAISLLRTALLKKQLSSRLVVAICSIFY